MLTSAQGASHLVSGARHRGHEPRAGILGVIFADMQHYARKSPPAARSGDIAPRCVL